VGEGEGVWVHGDECEGDGQYRGDGFWCVNKKRNNPYIQWGDLLTDRSTRQARRRSAQDARFRADNAPALLNNLDRGAGNTSTSATPGIRAFRLHSGQGVRSARATREPAAGQETEGLLGEFEVLVMSKSRFCLRLEIYTVHKGIPLVGVRTSDAWEGSLDILGFSEHPTGMSCLALGLVRLTDMYDIIHVDKIPIPYGEWSSCGTESSRAFA